MWLLEGYNYRKFKPHPLRPEGDRIVILQDTTGDGVADVSKVFYQGTDIDAAMGIAVLGNKVIVSAYQNIFVFTDTDGDDKPDKKEVLFTSIGKDHDHSTHAFVFGPDGRLYFNGGNETGAIMDAAGKVLVDRAGNRVEQKRAPYQEGMAFRLEPDGTGLEVLGYNFRNPYELTVDAFGTVWQSDNDDDGNRSTRLNYVMEGGNYGYRDEMTGAGWRARRTGMSDEIPRQHWHSDDPGSVPNVRINGAGAPSGITMYDGTLLPEALLGHAHPRRSGPERGARLSRAPERRGLHRRRPSDRQLAEGQDVPSGRRRRRARWLALHRRLVRRRRRRPQHVRPDAGPHHPPRAAEHALHRAGARPLHAAGAARALNSPNHATRYLAYEKLHAMGRAAETVARRDVPRHRRARRVRARSGCSRAFPAAARAISTPRRATPIRTSASSPCAPRAASAPTSSRSPRVS